MRLTVQDTIQKIQDEDLSYWKLFIVDKYIKTSKTNFSSFDDNDTTKSIESLTRNIELASRDEDVEFYIEARKDKSANQGGVKQWYFLAKTNNKANPAGNGNRSDALSGIDTLQHPFVTNQLGRIERREDDLKTYERNLSDERQKLFREQTELDFRKRDVERELEARKKELDKKEAELKELEKKYKDDVEAAKEGTFTMLKGAYHALAKGEGSNFLGLGSKEPESKEGTPEEKKIEAIAERIFSYNLTTNQLDEVAGAVELKCKQLTQKQ